MLANQATQKQKTLDLANPKGANLPPEERAKPQIIKGTGIVLFVSLVGALYWLVMLWDVKGIRRRNRHYWIKLRNSWLTYLRPDYVNRCEQTRRNECNHCGACCEILWRCPFLKVGDDGQSRCSVHASRPLQCRTFPVDSYTVQLISKDREQGKGCSYDFVLQLEELLKKAPAPAQKNQEKEDECRE